MDLVSIKEISNEMLECARYGELEDLVKILDNYQVNVDYKDENGNTALHKSCANGHIDIVSELLKRNASINIQNNNGNSPLHWAVTNKKKEVVIELLNDPRSPSDGGADVLLKNHINKSVLTEVFNINDESLLKIVLEHQSAEKLEYENCDSVKFDGNQSEAIKKELDIDDNFTLSRSNNSNIKISQDIIHELIFSNEHEHFKEPVIKCRELALIGIKDVFSDDPEDDTTGVHLWSSSIVASYWMKELSRDSNTFCGKKILELGCGCGLMGIVLTIYTKLFCNSYPSQVLLTDVSEIALSNAEINIQLNSELLINSNNIIKTKYLNWYDKNSWARLVDESIYLSTNNSNSDMTHPTFDIIIGSDLIYNYDMEIKLSETIFQLLNENGTFYYVHRHDRLCSSKFKESLEKQGLTCQETNSPLEYINNPLYKKDRKLADLLFNELYDNNEFYLLTARKTTLLHIK
ncbi:hypothetical protein FG379_003289 [Cryptosporidium bovis]|uniref:uncharacterized protein n=1 Tax=Cryptosporidium bovis TaxID=310047 RepID=UPI00351A12CA|nr:hypothetical protein FG379_003289 [Cryptosporidium bovis]